jgi:hypothetical protein
MNFLIFSTFVGIFALLDPDPDSEYGSGSGSTNLLESGSNRSGSATLVAVQYRLLFLNLRLSSENLSLILATSRAGLCCINVSFGAKGRRGGESSLCLFYC